MVEIRICPRLYTYVLVTHKFKKDRIKKRKNDDTNFFGLRPIFIPFKLVIPNVYF